MRTIEDKKYPLQEVTRFNLVVIKLQLISAIAFCDYEEEKITYAPRFLPRQCPDKGIMWNNCTVEADLFGCVDLLGKRP